MEIYIIWYNNKSISDTLLSTMGSAINYYFKKGISYDDG